MKKHKLLNANVLEYYYFVIFKKSQLIEINIREKYCIIASKEHDQYL